MPEVMKEQNDLHFVGQVTLKAVIVRGDEILINRSSIPDGMWELPGGRMHTDEEPESALRREVREEIGIEIHIGNVIHVEQFLRVMPSASIPTFLVAYTAKPVDPEKEFLSPDDGGQEARWVHRNDIKKYPKYEYCDRALEKYFSSKTV